MKVCLSGILEDNGRPFNKGRKYMLQQLYKHLEEVRADNNKLKEFFELYV